MRSFASRLLDTQFAGAMAEDAEWVAAGGTPTGENNCRVLLRRETAEPAFQGSFSTRMQHASWMIEVRVSERATLSEGDSFVLGGETYRVSEPPERPDTYRLKWLAVCILSGAPGG
jgi:hypothetical protein